MKGDIKEYFMSGTAQELTEDAIKIIENDKLRPLVKDVIKWLLDNQFVTNPLNKSLHRVVQGSGMGLRHSGELADAALVGKTEKSLEDDLCACDMAWFFRFKDDFLCLGFNKAGRNQFFQQYKKRAGYFKTVVEEV
eukprot:5178462-Karenia_brevis.AAC.1